MKRPDAAHWAKAWDDEIKRHVTELNTWTDEDPLPSDKPVLDVMTFKAKANVYGGLERHKVRCVTRGDRMRPGWDTGVDFDKIQLLIFRPKPVEDYSYHLA